MFSSHAINGISNVSKVYRRKRFRLSSLHIGIVRVGYLGFDDNSTFLIENTFKDILVKGFTTRMTHACDKRDNISSSPNCKIT